MILKFLLTHSHSHWPVQPSTYLGPSIHSPMPIHSFILWHSYLIHLSIQPCIHLPTHPHLLHLYSHPSIYLPNHSYQVNHLCIQSDPNPSIHPSAKYIHLSNSPSICPPYPSIHPHLSIQIHVSFICLLTTIHPCAHSITLFLFPSLSFTPLITSLFTNEVTYTTSI